MNIEFQTRNEDLNLNATFFSIPIPNVGFFRPHIVHDGSVVIVHSGDGIHPEDSRIDGGRFIEHSDTPCIESLKIMN